MKVVSNTSPIINLSCIGQLNILQKLYDKIYIPEAVFSEITIKGTGQIGVDDVLSADWIIKEKIVNIQLVKALDIDLDRGEAEAIALALQIKSELLLIDEKIGRGIAESFNLKYIGLLGILIEAKSKNYIKSIKSIMDDLIIKAGFWIKRDLYDKVLEISGEN